MDAVKADDVQRWGLLMEHARGTDAKVSGKPSSPWLPQIDQILLVGMKHGSRGIREATNKVISLRAGFTRGDCWKRLRSLRERNNGNHVPPRNWPQEVKDLLRMGYEEGGAKKRQAIKAIRELYPGLPSHAPSRFARRQGWRTTQDPDQRSRPWSDYEQRKLWELAGYEPAARIGERLGRSEGAVRYRLKMLSLSVKVKDGWSFRALQELLHVGPSKLRRFIVSGSLRVRDPRISVRSLEQLLESRVTTAIPAPQIEVTETLRKKLRKGPDSYSWGSAAKLLGVTVEQVQTWIARGDLKVVDGFVTERAFQDFCRKCGSQLNGILLGEEVRDWLADGYTLRLSADTSVDDLASSAKHALITRQCPKCQRRMRGNVFFRHVKSCKASVSANTSSAIAARSHGVELQLTSRAV